MSIIYETIHNATYEYPYLSDENHSGNFHLHSHKELEVLYLIQGSIIVTIGTQNSTLFPGDICIIPPDIAHTLVHTGPNRICIIKIHPYIDLSQIILNKNIYRSGDSEYTRLKEWITTMIREDSEHQQGFELAVSIAARQIILFLLRQPTSTRAHIDTPPKLAHISHLIDMVNDFLEENYKRKFSLEEIAQECNYTKCYFSRRFKQLTGMHFSDYYTIFRINKSINLLQNTSLSIEQVALESGFFNLRSYNQAFQKHFKYAPSRYRKLLRQNNPPNTDFKMQI